MYKNTFGRVKDTSLHFKHIWIVSLEIYCDGVQNLNVVTVKIYMGLNPCGYKWEMWRGSTYNLQVETCKYEMSQGVSAGEEWISQTV